MRRFAAACGILALTLLTLVPLARSAPRVRAGTAVRMDVPALVEASELILEGRVLSQKALENAGRVETEYLLLVERTFAGEDLPLRTVRIPGGTLPDGSGMLLAGMPRLATGENVLLFLSEPGETGIRVPVGLAQGKYRVVRTEQGEKLLVREPSGLSLVNEETGEPTPTSGVRVRTYSSVVAEIEAALAARRAAEERAREAGRPGEGR